MLIKIDDLTLPPLSLSDTGALTTIRTHESAMISIGVKLLLRHPAETKSLSLNIMRFYPRRTAPQFLTAAAMTASLIASISASLNVAFRGVKVMLTASDF